LIKKGGGKRKKRFIQEKGKGVSFRKVKTQDERERDKSEKVETRTSRGMKKREKKLVTKKKEEKGKRGDIR